MPGKRRRSYESGHRPKYLIVVDETPEWERALYFAARRAARTGAAIVTLTMLDLQEAQAWLGVNDLIRAEAEEKAKELLAAAAVKTRAIAGLEPEQLIREGGIAETILKVIDEDQDIAALILAASISKDGPGPLVSALASKAVSAFPIPVTIVPGGLSNEDLDAMT